MCGSGSLSKRWGFALVQQLIWAGSAVDLWGRAHLFELVGPMSCLPVAAIVVKFTVIQVN